MSMVRIAAAVVLASAMLIMAGCDLMPKDDDYEPKENEVLVSASVPAGPAPAWVEVRARTEAGKGVGFGVLSLKNGKYSGYVQASEAGAMKFIVTTGLEMNDKVQWIGSGTLTVQGKGQKLDVSLEAPAIGGTGPSGGRVFYDKGNYDDGWRYLEAYDPEEGFCQWATARTRIPGATDPSHGAGKPNTDLMSLNSSFYPAAKMARNLSYGGYYDWFLPSIDELETLLEVLGNSVPLDLDTWNPYWSSTEGTDLEGNADKAHVVNVRPNSSYFSWMNPYEFSRGTHYKDSSNGRVIGARRF
jgi:hypothetical protein